MEKKSGYALSIMVVMEGTPPITTMMDNAKHDLLAVFGCRAPPTTQKVQCSSHGHDGDTLRVEVHGSDIVKPS